MGCVVFSWVEWDAVISRWWLEVCGGGPGPADVGKPEEPASSIAVVGTARLKHGLFGLYKPRCQSSGGTASSGTPDVGANAHISLYYLSANSISRRLIRAPRLAGVLRQGKHMPDGWI